MIEPCHYCGEPATSVDHARPRSLDRALQTMDTADRALVVSRQPHRDVVPACKNCNCVLGNRWFETLEERRRYVKEYLRRKYRTLLAAPVWTEEELGELGWQLRTSVARRQRLRASVERRLRWPQSSSGDAERRMDAALDAAQTFLPSDRF